MATLALAAAGAAAGSALLPAGLSLLGATVSGATIGAQLGALAGSWVDQSLFAASGQSRALSGPRLSDLRVTASTEGAPIPRIYGRARVGGQVIWATDFEEEVVTSDAGGGGKGVLGGGSAQRVEYRYFANFAVALAEGEITGMGRVWADGQELDLGTVTYRLYLGSETQAPDSLIVAWEGVDNAPAYRGVAYVVFEHLALAPFGNRLPQLSFEVFRAVDGFHRSIRGVVMIPGSGEFAYAPVEVTRREADGLQIAENVHTSLGGTDWTVALDQLQATLPNATSVSLVTSWFGSDLRAGSCTIEPRVEIGEKSTKPLTWGAGGLTRGQARRVSLHNGRPAYGGTPSDDTVVAAIRDLKERGLSVTLTPFLLMDVPEESGLPDPYTGAEHQPPYPWRGRITVSPAPGAPGSPDKTAAAATQIAAFVGTASPGDFSLSGARVVYAGPAEWTYRRFILHHAFLAKAAGGVDAFVIGTELRGLTQVRDGAGTYPFVSALVALAADVKAVLGPQTKVTYAADWSEYFGHQPQDGSGDVYFHLDPLWASPHVDAIGVDLYWPLSDWRDGRDHADAVGGAAGIHDLAYLKSNVAGGEGFDWYYASDADRAAQVRTPITDGAGKPWMFRFKDLKSWWANPHFDRPGGVESPAPTAWVPQSKPFWFLEIGCPAVDKGANQPNVFVDPKSAESRLPHFSNGQRDDLMQRRYLQALLEAFDPGHPGGVPGLNPASSVYGGPMVDLARVHVYCWDARPHPAFPSDTGTWGDGANWRLGHWLTGRVTSAPLAECVARLLDDYEFAARDSSTLVGMVPGYVIDRVMSPRESLQPLELAYFFDTIETGGAITFRHRGAEPAIAALTANDLVETRPEAALVSLTRGQETELPASAKVSYASATADYRPAVAEARRIAGASERIALADLALVLDDQQAAGVAETWLFETWAARERASFVLPPSRIAFEPSDVVEVIEGGRSRSMRITSIGDHGAREVEARSIDPSLYEPREGAERPARARPPSASGQPLGFFLDLPLLRGDEPAHAGYFAALQRPWPRAGIALYRSPGSSGFSLRALAGVPAVAGTLLDPLPAGPSGRLDRATKVRVRLENGALVSLPTAQVLGGGNAAAVRNPDGAWEVLQFETATLVAPATYELSNLLRGQAGTERAMLAPPQAGAPFVLITSALVEVDMNPDDVGLTFQWRFGPADRDLGDPAYAAAEHTFAGAALRPLSPVHVRGSRLGGDLLITWVRRTRIGGDSWEALEVPLGEETERYEVDILDGTTVKRTLASSTPSVTYTAAQQLTDFGTLPSAVSVRVFQLSAVWGRGWPRDAVV
jgi:hypothetical protein